MKQTCPKCNEIISLDENLYKDGETIEIICPVCGNVVVFTIHHEDVSPKEPPKQINPNLTNCPECGNLVSKKAKTCPHCGVALSHGELPKQTEQLQQSLNKHAEKKNVGNANSQKTKRTEVQKTTQSHTGLWIGLGIVSIAIIVLIVVLGNNSENERATPMDATRAYYELLKKGDFKGAVQSTYDYNKTMTKEEKESLDAMLDLTASKIQSSMDEKGGLRDFTIDTSFTNDDESEVGVTIYYGNGEIENKTENLKKVNDKWYVK